jgi:coniferyl-aldehyde dehydrogenase
MQNLSNDSQLDRIVALQSTLAALRKAFLAQPMPGSSIRQDQLKRLKEALLGHRTALAAAEASDFGSHSLDEVMLAEIFPLVEGLNGAIKRVKKWMKPAKRRIAMALQPSTASVIYQPLGVVGVITPWNYPVLLSIGPLINIIAAGNRAMIKMSESTPATARAVRTMLADVFSTDQVTVVIDESGELADPFSRLRFDHLVFTGSGAIGRVVMRAAAEHLVPVTLELGGKSPVIIGEDAPLEMAVERICWGKSLKSGQSCTAPDYILCPRAEVEHFVDAYRECYRRMFPTIENNPDCTAIINEKQHRRLQRLVEDAEAQGARLEDMNPAGEDLSASRKLAPILIVGATEQMKVMQDEIFGPILPILPYDQIDEAIAYVNDHPRPLALYVFTFDTKLKRLLRDSTHSGAISFNDTMTHAGVSDLPFGGVGDSGTGHYHGFDGFVNFSKAKAVFSKGRFNSGRQVYAPYGGLMHRITLWMLLR